MLRHSQVSESHTHTLTHTYTMTFNIVKLIIIHNLIQVHHGHFPATVHSVWTECLINNNPCPHVCTVVFMNV